MTAATSILDARVLVLNGDWNPINVTKAWKSIHKVWKERALFVDPVTLVTYDFDGWVGSWDDVVKTAQEAALEAALFSGDEARFEAIAKESGDSIIKRDGYIQVGTLRIRTPEVIVCTEYRGMAFRKTKHRPKFSRNNVYRRDKNTCQYCGKKLATEELNMEHVIPRAQGGQTEWKNISLACIPCNTYKRDRTPEQAGMKLIREPYIPKSEDIAIKPHERLKRRIGKNAPRTWEKFLGDAYWNVEVTS